MTSNIDHSIDLQSRALLGKTVDMIICGSIGACESTRLIRQLRRLGAKVRPWLTKSALKFTTPTATGWAAATKPICELDFTSPHIGAGDALFVTPASANFISKLSLGIADTPCLTLAMSYLGNRKPLVILPNMELSLFRSPTFQQHWKKVSQWVETASPREEEGKLKFPDVSILANELAHKLRQLDRTEDQEVLITMGSTRGYLDPVRYLTNHSTGALGTQIAHELYRRGFRTRIACGSASITPANFTELVPTATNESMSDYCQTMQAQGVFGAVFAAAVLDYVPERTLDSKLPSGRDRVTVECVPTPKIIDMVTPRGPKIGFKLGFGMSQNDIKSTADSYITRYGLDLIVMNDLGEIDNTRHRALLYRKSGNPSVCATKSEIAHAIGNVFEQPGPIQKLSAQD